MAQMQVSRPEAVRLVLDFLLAEKFYKSFIALEQDSKQKLRSYGTEIDFFYDLLMEGLFAEAEKMIAPIQSRNSENYQAILFQIRKQAFLEKIEESTSGDVQVLVKMLKEIEQLAGKEEFSRLCRLLSLSKLSDDPEYEDWSVWKGRYVCFLACLSHLEGIEKSREQEAMHPTLLELLGGLDARPRPLSSPRLLVSPKESDRYSTDPKAEDDSEMASVHVESSVTDPEESADKRTKSVKWKEEASEPPESTGDEKRVYVETLDIVSNTDETSEMDDDQSGYHPPQNLFMKFDPRLLQEATRLEDAQPIRASVFNSSGEYFILGTNSKSLKVCSLHNIVDDLLYNQHQGRKQAIDVVFEMKNVHMGSVYCVDWSKSGTQIASGSNDKTIRVVFCPDFLSLQETQAETVIYSNGEYLTGEGDLPEIRETVLTGHKATIRTLCFHPMEDHLLLSGGIVESEIKVWNTEVGQCVQRLTGHVGAVYSIMAAGDGSFFASVGTDRKLRLWDLRTSRCTQLLNGEMLSEMNSVSINMAYQQMRAETKSKIAQMYIQKSLSQQQALHKSMKLAAIAHVDGQVSLWDLTAGKLQAKLNHHTSDCRSVEFSADANWLVTASFDGTIGVVDLNKGVVRKITEHTDRVVSARWHPYLPIILSTSADRTARIFCP
jgi:WD40 repeat protein